MTQLGEAHLALERRTRLQLFERFEHATEAEVVRDPAIDDVEVGTVLAVLERLEITIAPQRSSDRAGRVCCVRNVLNLDRQPSNWLRVLLIGITS